MDFGVEGGFSLGEFMVLFYGGGWKFLFIKFYVISDRDFLVVCFGFDFMFIKLWSFYG